jgi:EmrB/QacA subfamily drug resistance transporter
MMNEMTMIAPASEQNDASMPGPYKVVAATSFGVFLSAMDASIVNVSLVTMMNAFNVTIDAIQWVVVAYLLILTSTMPLMGKLGDRYGKKRVFQLGMLIFSAGSFTCAMSIGLEMLVVSRVFQALGSAMLAANGLALVTYFTTPQNRGRAIGLNSVTLAAALGSGPVLGGVLSEFFGWPSIFLVNIPIGIIGFFAVQVILPDTELVHETRFDTIGATLFFSFLFLIIYYVSVAANADTIIDVLLIGGAFIAFIGFILRERAFDSPVIAINVLADKKISLSIFSALLAYMASIPVSYLLPFYLQEALGFNQVMTGVFLIIQPLMISVIGPLAGFVSERIDAKIQTTVGLLIELSGLIVISFAVPNIFLMGVGVAIMGTGLSFFTVANGNFVMTAAPKKYMGVVSALVNLARTTGFSVATALATTVFGILFLIFNPWGIQSGSLYVLNYELAYQSTVFVFSFLAIIAAILTSLRGLNQAEEERKDNNAILDS